MTTADDAPQPSRQRKGRPRSLWRRPPWGAPIRSLTNRLNMRRRSQPEKQAHSQAAKNTDIPGASAPSEKKPAPAASRGSARDERPPGCARIVLNLPNPADPGARVAPRSDGYRREKPGPGRRLRGSRPTRTSNPSPVYVGPPPVRHDVSHVQGTPPKERRHEDEKGGCHGPRRRRNPVRRRSTRSATSAHSTASWQRRATDGLSVTAPTNAEKTRLPSKIDRKERPSHNPA